jgi:hypothetical protein
MSGPNLISAAPVGTAWPELVRAWAARHVFTHCDGIVDAKYLQAVPSTEARSSNGSMTSLTFAKPKPGVMSGA